MNSEGIKKLSKESILQQSFDHLEDISLLASDKLQKLYADNITEELMSRLNFEIEKIYKNHYEGWYAMVSSLVSKVRILGQPTSIRGAIGASLVAFLLGITNINPLPAHYYCKNCKFLKFIDKVISGFDLPDRVCPSCRAIMKGDGHNIPFEVFAGLDGEKVPNVELNFTKEMALKGQEFLEEIMPNYLIISAGWIEGETNRLRKHPYGLTLIPHDHLIDIPVEFLDFDLDIPISPPYYYAIMNTYYQQNIIPLVYLDFLKQLAKETDICIDHMPMNDKEVFQAIRDEGLNTIAGFDSDLTLDILSFCKPYCFSDMVKIFGLAHGTGTWNGNGKELIQSGQVGLEDLIAFRDDIFLFLLSKGLSREIAYKAMEDIGKRGADNTKEENFQRIDLPDWYSDSYKRVEYLFPKAHAISYTMLALQITWFKLNFRDAYNRNVKKFNLV